MKIVTSVVLNKLVLENLRTAPGIFPELIRKLIRRSVNRNGYTHFPSGDAIFTPGWDGTVLGITEANRYVPEGNSIWEIGTDKKALKKIEEDYNKRKIDGNSKTYHYIAVVSSILDSRKKQQLSERLAKDGYFKSVQILDANDIEEWLEEYADIAVWLLKAFGERIDEYDIQLIKDEWMVIAECTKPQMNYYNFLVGNEAHSKKFYKDLKSQQQNNVYTVVSTYFGNEMAYYFTVASLCYNADEALLDRCIIAKSQEALNTLTAFGSDLIILIDFNCLDLGHTLNASNTYILFSTLYTANVSLNMPDRVEFSKSVELLGFDSLRADRIAFLVDYNAVVLRRFLAVSPNIKIPSWARDKHKSILIPLLLMGKVDMNNLGDIDVLKCIVGDDYDSYLDSLNFLTEGKGAPLFRYNGVYKLTSRKEVFDFIQVDVFMLRVKKLEAKLKDILSNVNPQCSKTNALSVYYSNGSYIWRRELIDDIINGFIIMSAKNSTNQWHFDALVNDILGKLKGNRDLSLTVSLHFYLLAELSPKAFLNYIEFSLHEDRALFCELLDIVNQGFVEYKPFENNLLMGLNACIGNQATSLEALRCLLNIYYTISKCSESLQKSIVEYLSPLTTMRGIVPIPLMKKLSYFFNFIKDKDRVRSKDIVHQLYKGGTNQMMIPHINSYVRDPSEKMEVSYQEIFDMQRLALQWLMRESNSSDMFNIVRSVLNSIYKTDISSFRKSLHDLKCELETTLLDDAEKAKIYVEVIRTISDLRKFNNREPYRVFIPDLESLRKVVEPVELYERTKETLTNDNFALLEPPSFDDEKWYEKENEIRSKIRRNVIRDLIKHYGECIVDRIIKDCAETSYSVWKDLFVVSKNHHMDINLMIDYKCSIGLRFYLSHMDYSDIVSLVNTSGDKAFVCANLPFTKRIFDLVSDNDCEASYWRNVMPPHEATEEEMAYAFDKYLAFAPTNLLLFAALDNSRFSLEQYIKILRAIAKVQEDPYFKNEIIKNRYYLADIVEYVDGRWFSDEIAQCEFELLPFLLEYNDDYPLGIKVYFWEHPEALAELLVGLFREKDHLIPNTLGHEIFCKSLLTIGKECLIPQEYILQKKEQLDNWVQSVVSVVDGDDNNLKRYIKTALINILACCPKSPVGDIWPNEVVADVLEELARNDFDDPTEVASLFSCAFTNRLGVRTVGDGTNEFCLAEEYAMYQKKYALSHPIVSRALEYISQHFSNEGEHDKMVSVIGRD